MARLPGDEVGTWTPNRKALGLAVLVEVEGDEPDPAHDAGAQALVLLGECRSTGASTPSGATSYTTTPAPGKEPGRGLLARLLRRSAATCSSHGVT